MINQKLNEKIKKANDGKAYKIRARKRKDDYSLFLLYRQQGKRITEPLNLYVSGKISYLEEDKEIVDEAIKEQDVFEGMLKNKSDKSKVILKADFVKYFEDLTNEYEGNTKVVWKNTLVHLKNFIRDKRKNKTIIVNEIDKKLWEDFKKYLLKHVSNNSAYSYFSKIKQSLYKINLEEKPKKDILGNIQNVKIKTTESERNFLKKEELELLTKTDPPNLQVANAFLFSCFTGLRLSDVKNFTFEMVYDGRIKIKQGKTKEFVEMKLSATAKKILEDQKQITGRDHGKVFDLLNDDRLNMKLKQWVKSAGINKHITFHCARHTFACLLLDAGTDIYTVSKLLGHKKIKTTVVYLALIDEIKDKAIENLPEL